MPFLVLADHKNLLSLQSAKRLNSHQGRWALLLGRFNFSSSYHPESHDTKLDALSRVHDSGQEIKDPILPASCFIRAEVWDIERTVLRAQQQDPDPVSHPKGRLFFPASVNSQVLQWRQSSKLACHPGVSGTQVPPAALLVAWDGTRSKGVCCCLLSVLPWEILSQAPSWPPTTAS